MLCVIDQSLLFTNYDSLRPTVKFFNALDNISEYQILCGLKSFIL